MENAIINKIIEINENCLPISKLILKNNTLGVYSIPELLLLEIYSGRINAAAHFSKLHGLSKSYVGRIVNEHEKNGLLFRETYENDTRMLIIKLTPKGKTYTETVIQKNNSELYEKLSLLPDSEQKSLIDAFCIITNILK